MLRRQSKTIAVLLLLVFSQKAGLRLWMHHWLHESKTSSTSPAAEKFQQADDCFNEAMLPLQETAFFILSVPLQKGIVLQRAPQSPAPDREKIYYSLKGPPFASVHS